MVLNWRREFSSDQSQDRDGCDLCAGTRTSGCVYRSSSLTHVLWPFRDSTAGHSRQRCGRGQAGPGPAHPREGQPAPAVAPVALQPPGTGSWTVATVPWPLHLRPSRQGLALTGTGEPSGAFLGPSLAPPLTPRQTRRRGELPLGALGSCGGAVGGPWLSLVDRAAAAERRPAPPRSSLGPTGARSVQSRELGPARGAPPLAQLGLLSPG